MYHPELALPHAAWDKRLADGYRLIEVVLRSSGETRHLTDESRATLAKALMDWYGTWLMEVTYFGDKTYVTLIRAVASVEPDTSAWAELPGDTVAQFVTLANLPVIRGNAPDAPTYHDAKIVHSSEVSALEIRQRITSGILYRRQQLAVRRVNEFVRQTLNEVARGGAETDYVLIAYSAESGTELAGLELSDLRVLVGHHHDPAYRDQLVEEAAQHTERQGAPLPCITLT